MKRLLLVDDEKLMVRNLQNALQQEGYIVDAAHDGEEALNNFNSTRYDLILLDIMLPKIDGYSLCKIIRKSSSIPIIMLTARGDDLDKIAGLELGADDYVAKPFNVRELLARIKAILRRVAYSQESNEVLQRKDMLLDKIRRKVSVNGIVVDLTSKEYDLLLLLAESPGRVYSRDQLLELVWGFDFFGDHRTVDVHIRRLREKIEPQPAKPKFVLTKWGVGYYFNEVLDA